MRYSGSVDAIPTAPRLAICDKDNKEIHNETIGKTGHKQAIRVLLEWVGKQSDIKIISAGHRVVHGGREFSAPVKITDEIIAKLKDLIPLAPLHQPHNIAVIEAFATIYPDIKQTICFDTAFHRTQRKEAEIFPLPIELTNKGIIRYGFHGLSYEYISSVFKDKADRVIVAHLGNGASMCAMKNLKSVATTMGFTPLDGLMMGTRCGALDPGVILHLLQSEKMTIEQLHDTLYYQSGLKAVSGISHDMRELLLSEDANAKFAVELFCFNAARQLTSLIPAIGGLDAIIFTAGIGAFSPTVRKKICSHLNWLGLEISEDNNRKNARLISSEKSKVSVYAIPTNEELMIAKHC